MLAAAVIDQDFPCSGKPVWAIAKSGVFAIDLATGIIYRQSAIPYGANWVIHSKNNIYNPPIPTGGVTDVTASSPLTSSGGLTPNIAIPAASSSNDGYLSSADWNAFNNKLGSVPDSSTTVKGVAKLSVAPVSSTDPIAVGDNDTRMTNARTPTAHALSHVNGTDDIQDASGSQKGLLSSTDWNTFNNKLGPGTVNYGIAYSGTVTHSQNETSARALVSFTIPAGTLEVGDMVMIEFVTRKTSGSGSNTFQCKVDSAAGTGGTILAQYSQTAIQSFNGLGRFLVTGASAEIGWAAINGNAYGVAAVDTTSIALPIANAIYINMVNQKNTGTDLFDLRAANVRIVKYRP